MIPDWVARETRYLHEKAFHVLAAMFTDGTAEHLEDGSTVMVLREEWPEEVGLCDRFERRRVWQQLEQRDLVERRSKDHRADSGRRRDSFVCQDRIVQFSTVRNKDVENCTNLPDRQGAENPDFESAASRAPARAIIIPRDAPAAIHQQQQPQQPQPQQHPPQPPPPPPPSSNPPSVEEAMVAIGFSEPGQASELMISFGFNHVAIALRYLVRGLKRSRRGQQPPIESKTGYVIQFLGVNRTKKFEEVDDFGFLTYLAGWVAAEQPDPKVTLFPSVDR